MTQTESLKIRVLSLIATVAVVIDHAKCNSHIDQALLPWLIWHVPWFFMVSGYFFMTSIEKYSFISFLNKKFYSLIVPYLIWCAIGYLLLLPRVSSIDGVLDIFGIGKSIFPMGNWALWYVRALIIIMSCGLVISFMRSWIASSVMFFTTYCVIMLCVYYICTKSGVGISPGSGMVSFLIGNAFGFFRFPLTFQLHEKFKWMLLVLFFLLAATFRVYSSYSVFFSYLFILFMISGLWILLDMVHVSDIAFVGKIMGLSPIVYFMHYPIILAFDKYVPCRDFIGSHVLGSNTFCNLYYGLRCVLFLISIFGGCYIFRQHVPKLYRICSGGR